MRTLGIFLLLFFCNHSALADVWQPLDDDDLTIALAYGTEIADSTDEPGASYVVRVYAVPEEIGECWGSLDSCPDWRLYIAVSTGDLYEKPFLYRFINSKGWEFLGWQDTNEAQTTSFRVATEMPGANLDADARQKWKQDIWEFTINSNGLTASSIEDDS